MASTTALPWLYAAGTFIEAYGLHESARMARIQGERAKVAREFAAWNAERNAGLAAAISQRQAAEELRQGDLLASRALAVAAASGGGVSDPTVVQIIANTRGEAVYRANVALYEGEAMARKAKIESLFGPMDDSASKAYGYSLAATGTLARGALTLSLNAKYGRGGPDGGSGDAALLDAGTPEFSSVA